MFRCITTLLNKTVWYEGWGEGGCTHLSELGLLFVRVSVQTIKVITSYLAKFGDDNC